MASNMGIPEKKTDTLLYIIIVCCIIAFPVIVLAGYTLEMTADKEKSKQAYGYGYIHKGRNGCRQRSRKDKAYA